MDKNSIPDEFQLTQIHHRQETDIELQDEQFSAPEKSGIYYYDYHVWWMDEKKENVSNGDASYVFVLEVE